MVYHFNGFSGVGKTTALFSFLSSELSSKDILVLSNNKYTIGHESKVKILSDLVDADYQFSEQITLSLIRGYFKKYSNILVDYYSETGNNEKCNSINYHGIENRFVFVIDIMSFIILDSDKIKDISESSIIIITKLDIFKAYSNNPKELEDKIKKIPEGVLLYYVDGANIPSNLHKVNSKNELFKVLLNE